MTAAADAPGLPWLTRLRERAERAWDRIDATLLRLQGRVDTPSWDRGLPYALAALHAAILIVIVLARHNSLLMGEETAKFAQATWQIGEGLRPVTTISGGNVIAEQGSLILYPLGLITAVLPRTETLLVLKSLALGGTMIPLWRLGRRHGRLGIGATSAVCTVYGLYSAVHWMNAADFAPAVLALPALMWAVLLGFDEREKLMVAAAVFALCCRADLGLAVAGLGVLLWLERKRTVGRLAMLLGTGWFLVSIYGLQRLVGDGGYDFLEPYAAFGETPLRALWGIIRHPWQFLSSVGAWANFTNLVSLFAPVLFLPLTAPRYVLPAVPLYVLYMGADVPDSRLGEAAQTVPITVFVFVATVFALQRAGRTLVKRVRVERRIILALLLTGLIFFIRDAPSTPYQEPWQWGDRDLVDQARFDAVDMLPSFDVPVRASSSMLPLLSERLGVYPLRTADHIGDDGFVVLDDALAAAVADVDWILFDRSNESALSANDVNTFRARLSLLGWEVFDRNDEAEIDVYRFVGVIAPQQVEIVEETVETIEAGTDDEADADEGDDG